MQKPKQLRVVAPVVQENVGQPNLQLLLVDVDQKIRRLVVLDRSKVHKKEVQLEEVNAKRQLLMHLRKDSHQMDLVSLLRMKLE